MRMRNTLWVAVAVSAFSAATPALSRSRGIPRPSGNRMGPKVPSLPQKACYPRRADQQRDTGMA